jgi:cytochrome c oxidase subunit 2
MTRTRAPRTSTAPAPAGRCAAVATSRGASRTRALAVVLPTAIVAGCRGPQTSLGPAGIQADRIDHLFWLYFVVTLVVYLVVMAIILRAAFRRHEPHDAIATPQTAPSEREERGLTRIVTWSVIVTALALVALLFGDFATRRGLRGLQGREALVVRVTGRQWWWEFEYEDPVQANWVTSANELHLPVGRVVRFDLRSPDVIHSFWIPNLHGKKDLIPGHPTSTFLRADSAGTYTGQCAEFCGMQHATMRFVVVVEPEPKFQRWLVAQRQPAAEPVTASQVRGRQVFMSTTCISCHAIQGTLALARLGPDLTHVGSNLRLASATLPNTRGHLAGWIADPQRIRPGVRMPQNPIEPADLRALVDYLESLK